MTEKEKLMKLFDDWRLFQHIPNRTLQEMFADYLLKKGMIVPHCKVGDTVYFETYKNNGRDCIGIQPHTVDRINVVYICDTKKLVETCLCDWDFGRRVFLTREEAEAALKGGEEE